MPLQKLLFSATLTQDPEKLQRLDLYQPRLFSTRLGQQSPKDTAEVDENSGKYTFPVGLTVSKEDLWSRLGCGGRLVPRSRAPG